MTRSYPRSKMVSGETDLIANLANISAVLKEAFCFFWVGFYLRKDSQTCSRPVSGHSCLTHLLDKTDYPAETFGIRLVKIV